MAEGPMKLIPVECEGLSAKFSFSINMLEADKFTSPIYTIHDIAAIQFVLQHVSDGQNCYFIRMLKTFFGMELGIQLQVVCKEPEYNSSLPCTEKWTQCQIGHSKNTSFNVQIDVKMSKADLVVLKLYDDVDFTDFQLSTAEGSVAVHKAQLAVTSEVFKKMLSREWKETAEGCIKMEGVTLQTLHHLKDYIYVGALPTDFHKLCSLLLIARCYLMDNLKADCLTKLTQTVTSENLYNILEFSFLNKFPEITFAVLEAMSESMVRDARKIMTENQKSCNKAEDDKTAEQEPSNEETNK